MDLEIHRARRILGSAAISLLILCGFLAGISAYRLQRALSVSSDHYEYLRGKGFPATEPFINLQWFIRYPYTGTPATAAMLAGVSGAACILVRRHRGLLERWIMARTPTRLMVVGASVLSVSLVLYVICYLDFHRKVSAPSWYDPMMFWITLIAGIALVGGGAILQHAPAHPPVLGRAYGNRN